MTGIGGARRGFSLVEILVAMTLTLAVFAITLPFVRAQSRALGANAGRLDAEQVARFAQRAVDRELRLLSADPGQPRLVLAGPMAIAFTANLLAPDSTDTEALEVDPSAPATLTEGWLVANAALLPNTARSYPTVNYLRADGSASRNETVAYFLHPDTVTGRSDIYVLYRRVNARDSAQVVRGIYVPTDSAFFSYYLPSGDSLARVPAASLPLFWDSTSIAGVRAVGIRAGGFFRNRMEGTDIVRTVQWRTVLPATTLPACGAAPAVPTRVAQSTPSSGGYYVRVTWDAAADDGGGADDVRTYVISLRADSIGAVRRVVASVPATRASSYRYEHYYPTVIGSAKYGVQSVDCGGLRSAIVEHNSNLTLP